MAHVHLGRMRNMTAAENVEYETSPASSSLTSKFNRLSWWNHKKLGMDASIRAMSAIARDDIKAHPARSLLYAAYAGTVILPIPYAFFASVPLLPVAVRGALASVPLIGSFLSEGLTAALDIGLMVLRGAANMITMGWINKKVTPWAGWVSDRMKQAHSESAMAMTYDRFIEPEFVSLGLSDRSDSFERYTVNNTALAKDTLSQLWHDCCEITEAVKGGCSGLIHKPSDRSPDTPKPN
jgi:hypothetical protein